MLSALFSENLSEQGQELLEIVVRNNETLLRLVNELLDFEKILSGTLTFATKKHDIGALTTNVVRELFGYGQEKSINFVYNQPASPLFVDVHEHRFEQIMNNLLSNAAKFSEPGTDVIISIASENKCVIVSVKDSGAGIPEEFKEDLYKHFTQADSSATRQYGGTGLGLAISKAMTEGMGGSIDFESEVGVGTTFSVSFPASQ